MMRVIIPPSEVLEHYQGCSRVCLTLGSLLTAVPTVTEDDISSLSWRMRYAW